jgi:DNA polymerase I
MRRRLDDFFGAAEELKEEQSQSNARSQPVRRSEGSPRRARVPETLPPSYFVSATYDGKRGSACIKLYDPVSEEIFLWYDTTGHRPYLLTNLTPGELGKLNRLKLHPGFDHFETVKKYDPLHEQEVTVTKVVAKDPLAIGGRPSGCMRDIIPEDYSKLPGVDGEANVWEARIKYYQCYIYDRQMAPGMSYKIEDGELIRVEDEKCEKTVEEIGRLFPDASEDFLRNTETWARLLEYPAPDLRRIALDIEVLPPVLEREGVRTQRVPDPQEAEYPVICASFVDSDGGTRVLLLKRQQVEEGAPRLSSDITIEYFDSEEKLILEIFKVLWQYPFVITFNGDDFDLRYLTNRAEKLGIRRTRIPIERGRRVCLLKNGVHIDLYKFFFNKSIQIYAFSQKYRDVTLDSVGRSLLKISKIDLHKPMSELTYNELAHYCSRDAEITFQLTAFNGDLVMKLILALARISRMPMEDVSRQGVSRWIRNFLHFEHRRRNMLIPNAENILALKGATTTKAIIKGKKYKGAIVVPPVAGVHFNVAVMDFASLYPSIIKVHNLGYQSILCPHAECKDNLVPETPHWVCKRNKALESLLVGSLRDLRVRWYKPKSKDKSLARNLRSWYEVIQSALKVILNASYGVFGAESFDLYCPPVAEATAAIGRHVIMETINKAKALGIEVIYGDTDSLFLKAPSQVQIEALATWSKAELEMELDVEKVYRYAVFSSRKKNYLGVLPDGSVDVKGLTGKKRHIPELITDAFDEMEERLALVTSPLAFEEAKKDIRKIVRDRYSMLKNRKWAVLDDLAFEVVLGKPPESYTKTTPQHVKAASLLQERGYELKAGDVIRFVKVMKEPHVKPIQLASDGEIDVDKYVNYLQSTFDQVLDAMGLDFDEIIGLTKLERFM